MVAEIYTIPPELIAKRLDDHCPVSDLVRPGYGRPVKKAHFERIAAAWDDNAVGRIIVAMRDDGTLVVIDGNHRVHAAQRIGISELPATIFVGATLHEEAYLFRLYNNTVRLTALDKFRAKIEERDVHAVEIRNLLHRYGLDVAMNGAIGDGKLGAVSALESVHHIYGMTILGDVIDCLKRSFGDARRAYCGDALVGMAMFLARYHGLINRDRLASALGRQTPEQMIARATARRDTGETTAASWGKVARGLYNAGLHKHVLPEWASRTMSERSKNEAADRLRNITAMRKARGDDFAASSRKGSATRRARGEDLSATARKTAAARTKEELSSISRKGHETRKTRGLSLTHPTNTKGAR